MQPENALRLMLIVAGMMIFSLLIIGVGIMIGILPFALMIPKAQSLGYFGAAFGCIVGGLGALFGITNSYRQLAGKSDWMAAEYRTWLDRAMIGYLLLGIVVLLVGWMMSSTGGPDDRRIGTGMMILACIIVFQG